MAHLRSFEDLRIWQQARGMVCDVYRDFGTEMPGYGDFGFKKQLQCAAVSVMNNIAEGFERATDAEFARFLDIAKGSSGEVRSMYYVAEDQHYVTNTIADQRRALARQISGGIAALISHLRHPHDS